MELSFKSKKLRALCERNQEANEQLGEVLARLLHDALAELRAAPSIADIADWENRMKRGKRDRLLFEFGTKFSISFGPNHINNPVNEDGKVDWGNVSSLKILKVETTDA